MSKEKAAEVAATINKAMGKEVLRHGSHEDLVVTYLPTGILPIDTLLQGGLPRGRFVELFGDFSTLKSYVGYKAIANTQQNGGLCALIDTEHAYDPEWAAEIGVDTRALVLQHPPTAEEAIDVAEALIRSKVDLIVFDSVAAALPRSEQEVMLSGDKNVQPARLASVMSLAMRKLTAANDKTAVLWINQTRMNVGIMFGNPETVPGGKALPFYASYRLALRKAGKVTRPVDAYVSDAAGKPVRKSVKETTGQTIRATVEKSKLSKPFREVYFDFDLTTGQIDELGWLVNQGIERGVVLKEGQSWRLKGSQTRIRGIDNFKAKVDQDKLRHLLFPGPKPARSRRGLRKRSTS